MKKTLYRIFLLCLCLFMLVSCGKEVNNDPSIQLSEQTTAAEKENKEPSMSITDIDKLLGNTASKQLTNGGYAFYRKTLDRAGDTKYNDTFYKVIRSKAEFDALFADDKGSYDDTAYYPGSTSKDTFEYVSKQVGTEEFFKSNCLMVMIRYNDNYPVNIAGDLFLTSDKQLEFKAQIGEGGGYYPNSPGYYGTFWPISYIHFSNNGLKLNSEIKINVYDFFKNNDGLTAEERNELMVTPAN